MKITADGTLTPKFHGIISKNQGVWMSHDVWVDG